jgi:hypothetical protein
MVRAKFTGAFYLAGFLSAVFAAAGWSNGGGHLGFKGWFMKVVMMKLVGAGKLER